MRYIITLAITITVALTVAVISGQGGVVCVVSGRRLTGVVAVLLLYHPVLGAAVVLGAGSVLVVSMAEAASMQVRAREVPAPLLASAAVGPAFDARVSGVVGARCVDLAGVWARDIHRRPVLAVTVIAL